MFRGTNTINMDAKGRMAIPAKHRDALLSDCDGHLVITIDKDNPCLMIYPLHEWEKIEQALSALPSLNKAARRLQHLLIGHASDVDIDANGRILVPPTLREYASLEKKLMIVGQGRKLELWSEEQWQAHMGQWLQEEADEQELPPELLSLSL